MFKNIIKNIRIAKKNTKYFHTDSGLLWNIPEYAELDMDYLCNENNIENIANNIIRRKGVGDIKAVTELKFQLDKIQKDHSIYGNVKKKLYEELLKIPNKTHPDVLAYGEEPKLVKNVNSKKHFDFVPKEFYEISKRLNLVRTEQLGNVSGNRSYFLLGEMADMEQALINYFLERLLTKDYQLISVPEILPRAVIESCGMNTKGERNQVYTLDPTIYGPHLCLSGTSEIALAGFLSNKLLSEDELPLKLTAISRCYRAETSSTFEERGIFRVHEFSKVEMFTVCAPEDSDSILEDIRIFQEENFKSLTLHFQVLDMPAHELGAQAFRKYDIEAWMPGRGLYGEISSCSNCTDYQSRRLNIKFERKNGQIEFVHTLNGTACAIPRLLIALTETEQDDSGRVYIPAVLQKYMGGKRAIGRQKKVPELKLIKNKKH